MTTWFLYYLQDEPGESAEVPNCTQLPKRPGSACLRDLWQAWPLRQGLYHYRFKVEDEACGFVWQDVVNPASPLPVWADGCIHAKVLRLDKPERPASRLRLKPGRKAPLAPPEATARDPSVRVKAESSNPLRRVSSLGAAFAGGAGGRLERSGSGSGICGDLPMHGGGGDSGNGGGSGDGSSGLADGRGGTRSLSPPNPAGSVARPPPYRDIDADGGGGGSSAAATRASVMARLEANRKNRGSGVGGGGGGGGGAHRHPAPPGEAANATAARAAGSAGPAAAVGAGAPVRFPEGVTVGGRAAVVGVVAKPELNGQTGTVTAYDEAAGRFLLSLDGGGGGAVLKLRPANLEATASEAAPPPPPPPPAAEVDLFSFSSDSPKGGGGGGGSGSGGKAQEQPGPTNGGGHDGAAHALKLKARYEAHRVEQAKQGLLQWDEVDQRWVETLPPPKPGGGGSRGGGGGGGSGGGEAGGRGEPRSAATVDPAAAAAVAEGQAARAVEVAARQAAAVEELERRKASDAAHANAEAAIQARLDPALKAWSEEYGKKRNVRALLAGLHLVLWEDSGWQPVSIGDLLEDKAVLKVYRRASRVVHSDRTVRLGPEQRFVAKRAFDALTQAMADFNAAKA